MAQQLWKSFMEALAPPQHGEQPRRGGCHSKLHMVGEHPLSCCEQPSSHAEGQSSRAPPWYQEVMCIVTST